MRTAHEATEADKESVKLSDGFVVLQWEQGGLLSAAKLRLTRPKVRVVLLGCRTPKQIQEAMFVGAIPMADASELHDSAWILKL